MRSAGLLIIAFASWSLCAGSHAKSPKPALAVTVAQVVSSNVYSWMSDYSVSDALVNRIKVPAGYERVKAEKGSFEDWLRHLPLKAGAPQVMLYNGKPKYNQKVHAAVLNIDTGNKDLQQCADAVMRLRAEYLYSKKDFENLHFNFTSGDNIGFKKWSEGYRTQIKGNKVSWQKSANRDSGYKVFRSYMNTIFNYAGTSSLSKELKKVSDVKDVKAGDVFIVGGFPGHAVIVLDVCKNNKGEKMFMIAQSYMPAQDIHVLKNFNDGSISPWYRAEFGSMLVTPEWTFSDQQLMRW
jgi:hypothetical protein